MEAFNFQKDPLGDNVQAQALSKLMRHHQIIDAAMFLRQQASSKETTAADTVEMTWNDPASKNLSEDGFSKNLLLRRVQAHLLWILGPCGRVMRFTLYDPACQPRSEISPVACLATYISTISHNTFFDCSVCLCARLSAINKHISGS